jgi:hypothetical protein
MISGRIADTAATGTTDVAHAAAIASKSSSWPLTANGGALYAAALSLTRVDRPVGATSLTDLLHHSSPVAVRRRCPSRRTAKRRSATQSGWSGGSQVVPMAHAAVYG